jgi:hypothetical protein
MKKPKQKFTPEEIRDACADLYTVASRCMNPKDLARLRSRWESACIDCVLKAATRMADTMP